MKPEAFMGAGRNYSQDSIAFTLMQDQARCLKIVIRSSVIYMLRTFSMLLHFIKLCTAELIHLHEGTGSVDTDTLETFTPNQRRSEPSIPPEQSTEWWLTDGSILIADKSSFRRTRCFANLQLGSGANGSDLVVQEPVHGQSLVKQLISQNDARGQEVGIVLPSDLAGEVLRRKMVFVAFRRL